MKGTCKGLALIMSLTSELTEEKLPYPCLHNLFCKGRYFCTVFRMIVLVLIIMLFCK